MPTAGLQPEPWAADAACVGLDPDLFFPDSGDFQTARAAVAVCRTCPVTAECLAYALDNHETHGVWGATTPAQRRRLLLGSRPPRPINHGTHAGYQAHRRRGETACRACLEAASRYMQTSRAAPSPDNNEGNDR